MCLPRSESKPLLAVMKASAARDAGARPSDAVVLSIIAVGIGAVTAWLGGELADRLGIGVDEVRIQMR